MIKLLLAVLITPFCFMLSFAQDAPSQPAPEFPDYIVKPSEDLNPYGLSSLGNSTEEGAIKQPSGSLGSKTGTRPSNRDVNKPKKDTEPEQQEQANAGETNDQEQTETIQEEVVEYEEVSVSRPKSSSKLIKWVDENGVQHISNNLGSVPPQYRDQIK